MMRNYSSVNIKRNVLRLIVNIRLLVQVESNPGECKSWHELINGSSSAKAGNSI